MYTPTEILDKIEKATNVCKKKRYYSDIHERSPYFFVNPSITNIDAKTVRSNFKQSKKNNNTDDIDDTLKNNSLDKYFL